MDQPLHFTTKGSQACHLTFLTTGSVITTTAVKTRAVFNAKQKLCRPPVPSDPRRAPAGESLRRVVDQPASVEAQPPSVKSVKRQPPSVDRRAPWRWLICFGKLGSTTHLRLIRRLRRCRVMRNRATRGIGAWHAKGCQAPHGCLPRASMRPHVHAAPPPPRRASPFANLCDAVAGGVLLLRFAFPRETCESGKQVHFAVGFPLNAFGCWEGEGHA